MSEGWSVSGFSTPGIQRNTSQYNVMHHNITQVKVCEVLKYSFAYMHNILIKLPEVPNYSLYKKPPQMEDNSHQLKVNHMTR